MQPLFPGLQRQVPKRKAFHCHSVWQRADAPVHRVAGNVMNMVPADLRGPRCPALWIEARILHSRGDFEDAKKSQDT
jgi:hypothetical protein